MKSLDERVAIVTGAARGIGLGIATVLAGEGAKVVIADLDGDGAATSADAINSSGGEALGLAVDVTVAGSCDEMAARTLERWGRIDVLCANAGIYPHIELSDITTEQWELVMSINVRGALYAIQSCLPAMKSRHYGRVVLTSSITGSIVGQPGYAHYGASKAAMLGLMRSSALEVAGDGITINAVLPGNIQTPGFSDLGAAHYASMLAAIPLGVFGTPEDVGWAVRFLASEEASYVTGQTLVIDGGQVLPESA